MYSWGLESLPCIIKLLLAFTYCTTSLGISDKDMQGQILYRNMKMCS